MAKTGKGDNDTSSLWGWPREGAGEIPMKAAKPFAKCPKACARFHVQGAEGEYERRKTTTPGGAIYRAARLLQKE